MLLVETTLTVATKIRNTSISGYTLSGSSGNVIFTCNKSGAKQPVIFTANSYGGTNTGVTATVVQTTSGAGGYVTGDAQVADFTSSTGDKLCSIAGVKPISGLSQNLTIVNSRILAHNRGSEWQLQHFNAVSAVQLLLTVEYAGLNSQSLIGQGVANKSWREKNDSELTGATANLGNKTGISTGTNGLTSISYRGIENFWGNIWKWVDGININNGFAYISNINGNFQSDKFDARVKVEPIAA